MTQPPKKAPPKKAAKPDTSAEARAVHEAVASIAPDAPEGLRLALERLGEAVARRRKT